MFCAGEPLVSGSLNSRGVDMKFYETRMGRCFFERKMPQLIKAIQELAVVLSKPSPAIGLLVDRDPSFLSDLYYGQYEPAFFTDPAADRQFSQAVQQGRDALLETLSEQGGAAFIKYEDAVYKQHSAVVEQAYESGFRTAVQMLLSGLSQPNIPASNGELEKK